MKNLYFVQVGFDFDGAVYLPYAVGTIIAYCQNDPWINETYCFQDIIFRREKLDAVTERITDPFIVAFSCNTWNIEYNKALAARIKARYRDCIILFGGHSVAESGELIETEDYIDILMLGEGEQVFSMLLHHIDGDLSCVPNIVYRKDKAILRTERKAFLDISDYPSPYLNGLFDTFVEKNPGVEFLSVLETNRGCPYACAYCDWCSGRKMRFFPLEKVYREIEWLAKHKIAYCFCADSNFGMFDRDVDIAKFLVKTKEQYGYPQVFRPCYEKNSADRVFQICYLLNQVGMDKGATMAYQTLSDDALRNIGRQNLTLEHFSALMKRYNEAQIPTYSELILGLPGETKQSFCEGICRLLESGQHNSISVYHCEVLPNSMLATPDYIKKHGIEIIRVAFNHIHSAIKEDEEVQEYSYLVRSTATMSREDWVYSNLFSICVQCFHSLGLLRYFAIYLYAESRMTYFDFYSKLLTFIFTSTTRLRALFDTFKTKYESSLRGDWNYHSKALGNVTWFFEEGAFLEIIRDFDAFFQELAPFLQSLPIENDVFADLLLFQKAMLRKPGAGRCSLSFHYNLYSYFEAFIEQGACSLKKAPEILIIHPKKSYSSFPVYAKEVVWYGRRRGMTLYQPAEMEEKTNSE